QVAIAMAQINEAPPELPVTISEPVRNLVYSCISKNPADRPASAAHLARAAQALRRGDIAGAVASVPAVVGDSSLAALEGPNYGNPNTTRMPATATVESTPNTQPNKRNPWTWPLVALIVVLLVVLVGTIIALVGQNGEQTATPTDSATSSVTAPVVPPVEPSTEPTTAAPTPSVTPTNNTVVINQAQLSGLTQAEAEQTLSDLELGFDPQPGVAAPTQADVGKSYQVSPTGSIAKNTLVKVLFYTEIPTPPAPTTATAAPASATAGYVAGSNATISWPAYTGCPAGYTFSGYNFSVTNASGPSNPIDAGDTSLTIKLGAAGPTTVSYYALCGELQSEVSDETTITVVAANTDAD
ncbi:MAG: pknA, partial [Glaciihabitans sp.]|nr:pknA [Glaciihabitans sp.]